MMDLIRSQEPDQRAERLDQGGWLRWDSDEAKVARLLFLELCYEEPEEYRNRDRCEEWQARYLGDMRRHVAMVRRRHEQTKYHGKSVELKQ